MKPFRFMKARTDDAYSPNQILLALLVASALASLFAGGSLWIPASRIANLHIRAIALSVADSISALAAETGLDGYMPKAREGFLALSGLSGQTEWDTRYFNRRSGSETPAPIEVPEPDAEVVPEPVEPAETEYALTNNDLPDSSAVVASPVSNSSQASDIHSSANPLRVYMFGDSQVFSLGNGLSRLAGKDSPIAVDFLAVHSSGFIRGDYFSWPAKLADTLSAASYDTAVMMLGMNDYQNFWNSRGEIMKKHTPEWEAAYADKCASLIDTALLYVPRLYWVGMPRVKDPQYEESLRYIDGVQDRIAARYGPDIVIRYPINDSLPGSNGEYLGNVTLESGKTLQAMSADGNHFTVEGGQFAMSGLFRRLSSDWLFSEIPIEHMPE